MQAVWPARRPLTSGIRSAFAPLTPYLRTPAPYVYGGATGSEETYAFDNARAIQRTRLRTLAELLDAGTVRHLEALGVAAGSRCLEVGAGSGSIALWLADRVGPAGAVVATDLDTTVLGELSRPNLVVRTHNVMTDDLPDAEFDVVHMRLLLAWLDDPARALRRLVAAVKPGGALIAEEMDFVSVVPDPHMDAGAAAALRRVAAAHDAVLAARHAFDPYFGRRLPGELADAGLAGVRCEGRAAMWRGGEAGGAIWRLTLVQLRDEIVADGLASAADVDHVIALGDDPSFSALSPLTIAAWGRRR
jgi:SAM-dependent methyltransferase